MGGYLLGQNYGDGRTQQLSFQPGAGTPGFPALVAGAAYTCQLMNADWFRLVSLSFLLTTDATAGNRYVSVQYLDGQGVPIAEDSAAVLVTPSTTGQRFVGQLNRGAAEWNTGTDVMFNLSGLWLETGRSVKINVANIGAADTFAQARFTFDRTPVAEAGLEPELAREREARAAYAAHEYGG